jgi:hypothetical protein
MSDIFTKYIQQYKAKKEKEKGDKHAHAIGCHIMAHSALVNNSARYCGVLKYLFM